MLSRPFSASQLYYDRVSCIVNIVCIVAVFSLRQILLAPPFVKFACVIEIQLGLALAPSVNQNARNCFLVRVIELLDAAREEIMSAIQQFPQVGARIVSAPVVREFQQVDLYFRSVV